MANLIIMPNCQLNATLLFLSIYRFLANEWRKPRSAVSRKRLIFPSSSFPLGKQLEFRDTTKYPYKGLDIKDLVSLPGNFPNCVLNYIVNPKEKFHIYLYYL